HIHHLAHEDWAGLSTALSAARDAADDMELHAAAVATVVPELLGRVEESITEALGLRTLVIGRDLPLPLPVLVDEPEAVGSDRLCVAAGAYERARGTCTVIDFGTAVTVDLVDDTGAFQGGAILPGLGMQARALCEHTAALPTVPVAFPGKRVGKCTTEAIQSGICYGLAGAVRHLVEGYALELNQWPYVVATGGDAETMMDACDFIDAVVPDLCLRGVGLAYVKHLDQQIEDS
ncbi:MAG: type III pantothenate kinase, partial [bacterium]|nr:type III pantothenate kinase [bacterium]